MPGIFASCPAVDQIALFAIGGDYGVIIVTNACNYEKVWGDFPEATPIRKEVNDTVLVHCTGLVLFSEQMNNSLVFL